MSNSKQRLISINTYYFSHIISNFSSCISAASNGDLLNFETPQLPITVTLSTTNRRISDPAMRLIGVIRPLLAEPKINADTASIINNNSINESDNIEYSSSINDNNNGNDNSYQLNESDTTNAVNAVQEMHATVMPLASTLMTADPMPITSTVPSINTNSSSIVANDDVNSLINNNMEEMAAWTAPAPSMVSDRCGSNSIVFNFQNRDNVPDYIDNSSMLPPRRELHEMMGDETGCVLLNGMTLIDTTDAHDFPTNRRISPPSPCNVAFENANVIINGRSNIKGKLKDQKRQSIQFNESLTSTFEYPSENSLRDDCNPSPIGDERMQMANGDVTDFMTTTPLASVPLGNYVPQKATMLASDFELGVTPSNSTNSENVTHTIELDMNDASADSDDITPANDEQTIIWSEGASDLLF